MSKNEWDVAEQCFKKIRPEIYIIVRVLNAVNAPVLSDILIDPVRLEYEGKLILSHYDLIVRSGSLE